MYLFHFTKYRKISVITNVKILYYVITVKPFFLEITTTYRGTKRRTECYEKLGRSGKEINK